jgi:hypothetical protein
MHVDELTRRGIPFVAIRGDWDARFRTAVAAVAPLLRPRGA